MQDANSILKAHKENPVTEEEGDGDDDSEDDDNEESDNEGPSAKKSKQENIEEEVIEEVQRDAEKVSTVIEEERVETKPPAKVIATAMEIENALKEVDKQRIRPENLDSLRTNIEIDYIPQSQETIESDEASTDDEELLSLKLKLAQGQKRKVAKNEQF